MCVSRTNSREVNGTKLDLQTWSQIFNSPPNICHNLKSKLSMDTTYIPKAYRWYFNISIKRKILRAREVYSVLLI